MKQNSSESPTSEQLEGKNRGLQLLEAVNIILNLFQ
jgi:hypothetical protein